MADTSVFTERGTGVVSERCFLHSGEGQGLSKVQYVRRRGKSFLPSASGVTLPVAVVVAVGWVAAVCLWRKGRLVILNCAYMYIDGEVMGEEKGWEGSVLRPCRAW